MGFTEVKYWAKRVYDWFDLWGFIILIHVINWVAVESNNLGVRDYSLMQGIKESSTLRVGPKYGKPVPRIVCRFDSQSNEIKNYLEYRKTIKSIMNFY
jgi:hypothetical protein